MRAKKDRTIGIRLDQGLTDQLEEVAAKTSLSYTDVVTQALSEYLPKVLKNGKVTITKKIA